MPQSEQKRQHKLAKKHAKDLQRRKKLVQQQQQMSSLAGRMSSASHGKIISAGVSETIATQGMGYVTIVRQGPDGLHALAAILVDSYCLGVKDALGKLESPADVNEILDGMKDRGLVSASPGVARAVVDGAIAYGRQFGFEPHPDYRKIACLFGDIEPESIEGLYSFGRNGKPCYVSGPNDDAGRQRLIISKLKESVGEGNYDFILMGGFGAEPFTFSSEYAELYEEFAEAMQDWRTDSVVGEFRRVDQPQPDA